MNLLNKPGMQLSHNSAEENAVLQQTPHEEIETIIDKKYNLAATSSTLYYYLIIGLFVGFIVFCCYIFISNSASQSTLIKKFHISTLFTHLANNPGVDLSSLAINDGSIRIIINCKSDDDLYNNLPIFKLNYKNVKIRMNNDLYQLWIEDDYYINNAINHEYVYDALEDLMEDKVEKEIIDEHLIIVGTLEDFLNLFVSFENRGLYNMKFNIDSINDQYSNVYYKLLIE